MAHLVDFEAEQTSIALTRLFHRDGLMAPSVRAIAGEVRASASGLMTRFDNKDRLLARSVLVWTEQFLEQLREWLSYRPDDGLFPTDEDGRVWIRALLAWEELGRSSPAVAAALASLWNELGWVVHTHGARLAVRDADPRSFDGAVAALRGLWARQLDLVNPLAPEAAQQLWVAMLGRSAAGHDDEPCAGVSERSFGPT